MRTSSTPIKLRENNYKTLNILFFGSNNLPYSDKKIISLKCRKRFPLSQLKRYSFSFDNYSLHYIKNIYLIQIPVENFSVFHSSLLLLCYRIYRNNSHEMFRELHCYIVSDLSVNMTDNQVSLNRIIVHFLGKKDFN